MKRQKDIEDILREAIQMVFDAKQMLWKRCLLEGHCYGIEGLDKEPKDYCIYCGEPKPDYNWWDNKSIEESIMSKLEKITKKGNK